MEHPRTASISNPAVASPLTPLAVPLLLKPRVPQKRRLYQDSCG